MKHDAITELMKKGEKLLSDNSVDFNEANRKIIFAELNIPEAEKRMEAAVQAGDEKEYAAAKEELETLKIRAELNRKRLAMGKTPQMSSADIIETFTPATIEFIDDDKRLSLELADALENLSRVANEAMENIRRYNAVIDYWQAYVCRTDAFPIHRVTNTRMFQRFSGNRFSLLIETLRNRGNGNTVYR